MFTRSEVHANTQRLVDESFNKGNIDMIEELFTDDYVNHPLEIGRSTYMQNTRDLRAMLPDVHASTDLIVTEGNWLAYRFSVGGTFTNAYPAPTGPIPPNHKAIAFSMIIFQRLNDAGHTLEEWVYFDNLDFLTQVGVIPAAGGAEAASPTLPPLIATEAAPKTSAMEGANKTTIQRVLDEIINSGKLDLADQLFDAGYLYHLPGMTLDRAGWKIIIEVNRAAFPDLKLTAQTLIAEGKWVALRFTMTGTFTNPIPNPDGSALAPTNGPIDMPIGVIFRFNDQGKIAEAWEILDQNVLLKQLGVFPAS